MSSDERIDIDYAPAGQVIVRTRALDASGQLLGTGTQNLTLSAGLNEISPETCTGSMTLVLGAHPEDGNNTVDTLHAELTFTNPDNPAPSPIDVAPGDMAAWQGLWSGPATLSVAGRNAQGVTLGTSTQRVDVVCGENPVPVCLGWLKVSSRKFPYNAATIRVTAAAGNGPNPLSLAPGGSANAYGFATGQTVTLTAEAFDASDVPLGSQTRTLTLACGENEVVFDIVNYGIMLTASPDALKADGIQSAVVTATLREWTGGDTVEPTGDPVPGRLIQFITTLGTLAGTNPAVSDAGGQATVHLSSTVSGTARLHAGVDADSIQSHRVVEVRFDQTYGIVLTGSASQVQADGVATVTVTAMLKAWRPGDVGQPTGDAVSGKSVTFSTTLGTLAGANPGVSNASGIATVLVSSSTAGIARLTAAVTADGVVSPESEVVFTAPPEPDGMYVSGSGSPGADASYIYTTSNSRIVTTINGVNYDSFDGFNVWMPPDYDPDTQLYHGVLGYPRVCQSGETAGVSISCLINMEAEVGPLYVHMRRGGMTYTRKLCDKTTISQMFSRYFEASFD